MSRRKDGRPRTVAAPVIERRRTPSTTPPVAPEVADRHVEDPHASRS
ncbi:hypothetical protein [Microbacterium lemovicicum]|nr:hypothetical protein [Microbacterium lemovicicum]